MRGHCFTKQILIGVINQSSNGVVILGILYVRWGDTKGTPALRLRRWWAEPVVCCLPIGQCWCDILVGSEQPTTKSMLRRVSCTSELSHANML